MNKDLTILFETQMAGPGMKDLLYRIVQAKAANVACTAAGLGFGRVHYTIVGSTLTTQYKALASATLVTLAAIGDIAIVVGEAGQPLA